MLRWSAVLGVVLLCSGVRCAEVIDCCLNVKDYGAVGDNSTINTVAIQKALTDANQGKGCGCVEVSEGIFITGDLNILSNTLLYIDSSATLAAQLSITNNWMLSAENQTNISIVGGGMLDGRSNQWIDYYQPYPDDRLQPKDVPRPHLVWLKSVTGVNITKIHFHNSSNWNCRLDGCNNVWIDSVTIKGDHWFPNNDGIDPESGNNITIVNSVLDVADDGICPKASAQYGPLTNLHVKNCTIRSRSSAIKFGSNTDTEMSNMLFENITIWGSNRGLGIQQRSQGSINNITFRDIRIQTEYTSPRWWGSSEPIWISSEPRNQGDVIGALSNILYENIVCESENGVLLSGLANGISNITLKNVAVQIVKTTDFLDRPANFTFIGRDHRPWLGSNSFYDRGEAANITGIVLENASNVALINVSVRFAGPTQSYWGRCFARDSRSLNLVVRNFECFNPV